MTRSVTIVNTSNWKHEDVERIVSRGFQLPSSPRVLKPGDMEVVGPYSRDQPVTVFSCSP